MHLFSYILTKWAPAITSEWFIAAVVFGLAAWSVVSGLRLFRGQRKVVAALRRATALVGASGTPAEFVQTYETLSQELAGLPLIGPAWSGFAESLIVPRKAGRPIVATVKPGDCFNLAALFREAGTDLRFHAALPGLLVGAGLLCTFLGLAVALAVAGGVVSGDDSKARLNALHELLGAASVKFITSLFGLLFSILYALWRKRQLYRAELADGQFLAAVRRLMPFQSTAALQAAANDLAERQFSEVERIGTDFFVNLGSTLEREFSSGLQNHIGPLATAVDKLAERLAGQNEGAVGSMLGAFLERLEGAVGESMRTTAATLQTLETRLDGLRGAMDDAAARMGRAAEEMAAGMGRGAQDALGGITEQMAALVRGMREAADEAGRSNRMAGEELAQRMGSAAEGLTQAVDMFQQRFAQGAADGVDRLAGPIEAMLAQLGSLAGSQREVGEAASEALAATVGQAARSLETTADRIADTLGTGATDASGRLVAATEAMRDDLRNVLERFGSTLAVAGASVEQGAKAGGETLASAASAFGGDIATAAARLAEAGDSAGAALRGGGADARQQMAEAARVLMEGASSLNGRLGAIAAASEGLAGQTVALQVAARDAANPLQATAVDLRSAGAAARDAAAPLAEAGLVIRITLDSLRQAAETIAGAYRQADALAARLSETAERFRGVDQAIASSTAKLASGIGDMERQVSEFVRGMDSNLAKSVGGLHAVAQGLETAAEDLAAAHAGGGD